MLLCSCGISEKLRALPVRQPERVIARSTVAAIVASLHAQRRRPPPLLLIQVRPAETEHMPDTWYQVSSLGSHCQSSPESGWQHKSACGVGRRESMVEKWEHHHCEDAISPWRGTAPQQQTAAAQKQQLNSLYKRG